MRVFDSFSLPKHEGPYKSWPLTTELWLDGRPTGTRIPGYVIEAQYRCGDRYLIATSWDCPFEEMQTFVLLSPELRVSDRSNHGFDAVVSVRQKLEMRIVQRAQGG
jgi:hypothetical protein